MSDTGDPQDKQNSENSDDGDELASDVDLSEDDLDVIQDIVKKKQAPLQKLSSKNKTTSLNSRFYSDDDDDLVDDDSDNDRRPGRKNTSETVVDDFIVGDNGENIQYTIHRISGAQDTHLNSEHVSKAWGIFADEGSSIANLTRKMAPKVVPDLKSGEDEIPDDFERDCDRCRLAGNIIPHTAGWIFENMFKNRIVEAEMNENDLQDEDGQSAFAEHQQEVLEAILNEMFKSEKDSHSSGSTLRTLKTPQYIINYKSDVYSNSIFSDQDIFNIQAACKKYQWILDMRQKIVFKIQNVLESKVQKREESNDPNRAQKDAIDAFKLDVLQYADSAVAFNDLRKHMQYHLMDYNGDSNKANASHHVLFFKHRQLFGQFCNEFLLSPTALAMKISDDSSAQNFSDPPEPTHPPQQTFEDFLDSNPDYREICELDAKSNEEPSYDSFEGTIDPTKKQKKPKTPISIFTKTLVSFAAKNLSTNGFLHISLRDQLESHLVVSTTPTERGDSSPLMLPYGRYGPVKRLKNKMTVSFHNNDMWLLIDEARKLGLLSVTIDIDGEEGINGYYENLKQHYTAQYGSAWDEIRIKILKRAFFKEIWPQFIRETEADLFQKASEFVKDEIENKLFLQLTAPPYTTKSETGKIKILENTTIMSFCYHPDMPKEIGMAVVGPKGNVENWDIFNSSLITSRHRVDYSRNELPTGSEISGFEKSAIAAKLKINEIFTKRDEEIKLVVVAATCVRATQLYKTLVRILEDTGRSRNVRIIFANPDAAIIYSRSPLSEAEKRELNQTKPVNDLVLMAASTARRVQNPLSELTRLASSSSHNYLVNLPLHRFQSKFVKAGQENGVIHEACERACLRAVSISGVDVHALQNPHHRGPLQFVPGLGPKWAEYILTSISSHSTNVMNNRVYLQFDVIKTSHKIINKNAIPFMRFPATRPKDNSNKKNKKKNQNNEETHNLNYLDGTLIPPKEYNSANEIVRYFLRKSNDANITQEDLHEFFEQEIDVTELLDEFCQHNDRPRTKFLEFLAHELKTGPFETLRFQKHRRPDPSREVGGDDALSIFRQNRDKIYADPHNDYCPLTDFELFNLLIANDESVKVGACVDLKIKRRVNDKIYAIHDGTNLEAESEPTEGKFTKTLFDDESLEDTYRTSTITRIDYKNLKLYVSFDEHDIAKAKMFDRDAFDDTFDIDGEIRARAEAEERAKNKPHKYDSRYIHDENFMNVTFEQAKQELADREVGTFFFRPSSKGLDHLSLTMKFPGNTYANYDIVERGKKSDTDLTLGKELYIEKERFDDLEDILWNFVMPIKDRLSGIMNHRKWVENIDIAIAEIKREKEHQPNLIPYRLTIDPQVSNCICLAWIGFGKTIKEPIRITPNCFRYRHQDQESLEKVINFWKERGSKEDPKNIAPLALQSKLTEAEERERKEAKERDERRGQNFGQVRGYEQPQYRR